MPPSMRFRKPHLIPFLFIVGATVLLCTLGSWQVERLLWKQQVMEAIRVAGEKPVLAGLPESLENLDYRRIRLSGRLLNDKAFHLVGTHKHTGNGFYIVTPLETDDDGRIVLVNRGFSRAGKESRPEGIVTLEGLVRPARQHRPFAPDNMPQKNLWFWEDVPAMSAASGVSLSPLIVEETGTEEAGVYPIPSDGTVFLRNDHLHYAITWFSIALIGIVMFIFYHRVPDKET